MTTQRRVLVATISASSAGLLMQTVVVAIPAIQRSLNSTAIEALWVANVSLLFLGALILVGGALGDLYGRERVFLWGVVGFMLTCVLCAVAPDVTTLIIARALHGVAGALMVPNSLAILSASFEGEERAKVIGTWSSTTTLASAVGPILGGFLVDVGAWRALFLLGVPFTLVTLWAMRGAVGAQTTPKLKNSLPPLDALGAGLVTLSLAAFVYSAMRLGQTSIGDALVWGALGVGVLSALAFVAVEARAAYPILPLALFRSRVFSGANLYTFFIYSALVGVTTFATIYLVSVRDFSATTAGVAFLPVTVAIVALSPTSGRWAGRVGARPLLVLGGVLVGVGTLGIASIPLTDAPPDYLISYFPFIALFGVGLSLLIAPLTNSVMSAVPQESAGVASGVNYAVARSAGALATAVLGAMLIFAFTSTLDALARPALDDSTYSALMAQSAFLLEAQVPFVSAEVGARIADFKREAYHTAFIALMIACALMSWVGAGIAYATVGTRKTQEA